VVQREEYGYGKDGSERVERGEEGHEAIAVDGISSLEFAESETASENEFQHVGVVEDEDGLGEEQCDKDAFERLL
jgi:hypothetical protein